MRSNAPISNGTFGNISSAFQQRLSVATSSRREDEEAEIVESQIDWFEQTRMDRKKKNRYGNTNLQEVFNYEEKFAKHLEQKRDKKRSTIAVVAVAAPSVGKKITIASSIKINEKSVSGATQHSPASILVGNLHNASTNRSARQHSQTTPAKPFYQ